MQTNTRHQVTLGAGEKVLGMAGSLLWLRHKTPSVVMAFKQDGKKTTKDTEPAEG